MNLIKILRYILGYVSFAASGGFRERFINLLAVKKITVWNVEYNENSLTCCVRANEYKKLRSIAKASGMKINSQSKIGLPFLIFRYRNRIGLFYGIIFFIAFMTLMSNFIWTIDVTGNINNNSEEIIELVESLGVKVGALKSKINEQNVSRTAVDMRAGKLLWMAINIKGSRAVIDVRDYIENPENTTYGEPCNIIADFSGEILSMEVYNGKKANFEGGGVKKGDLLISGVVENRDFSSFYVEARGKISALHDTKKELKGNDSVTFKSYTQINNKFYLYIFGIKIPLTFSKISEENCDVFEEESYLSYNDVKLPMGIIKKTYMNYVVEEKNLEDSVLFYSEDFGETVYDSFKNTKILSYNQKISKENNLVAISGEYKCIDFMGKKQKISLTSVEN